jgi:filamentous hemagglutinin
MPWNGAGSYVLPPAYSPEVNGTVIDATRYNGLTSDVASGISNAVAKDGQNVPTANLPMGGFKHTGAADANAAGQYIAFNQATAVGSLTITTLTVGTLVGPTAINTLAVDTLTVNTAFTSNGTATIGNAAGDALTINSSAASIPNGLSFNNLLSSTATGNSFLQSSSGASGNFIQITNTNAGASAFAAIGLTAANGGGDSYIAYLESAGTQWTSGLDNSDSNAFVISMSGTPGTNNAIRISTAGAITIPGTLGVTGLVTGAANFSSTGTGVGFTQSSSNSGAGNSLLISNTSNTATSDAGLAALVGGASAGTPYLQLSVSGVQNWFVGCDNTVSDEFYIGAGSAILSNKRLQISTAGAVSIPGTLSVTGGITAALTGNVTGNVSGSSGSTTGNAATAAALQTARQINGTNFDGTANITVTAAAGTLTGATLAAGVTASSLTSVGTLTSLTTSGLITSTVAGQGFLQTSASSGAGNFISITNTDASGGALAAIVLTAQAGGGDPYAAFIVNATASWAVGADNSDSDAFVISASGSPGTSNAFRISTAGAVTIPGTLGVTGAITGNLTGNITGTAPAGTLTGATLAAGVTASSLTSVGTLTSLTASGTSALTNLTVSGTSAHTGAATFDGNVTLGNAAADTITITGTPAGLVLGGTSTATVTAVANCSAAGGGATKYHRIGNVVTLSCTVTFTITSIGVATSVGVSIPIPSNFTVSTDAAGTGASTGILEVRPLLVTADTTNDRLSLDFVSSASGAVTFGITASYEVK